jgi:hypothetical protein
LQNICFRNLQPNTLSFCFTLCIPESTFTLRALTYIFFTGYPLPITF